MRPVFIKTFGCKVNYSESVSFADLVRAAGYTPLELDGAALEELLPDASEVERPLIFVNSCCVTTEAERKAAQFVRRVKRLRPESEVLFTGCGARNYATRDQYAKDGARVFSFYPEAFEWMKENQGLGIGDSGLGQSAEAGSSSAPQSPVPNTQSLLPTGIVGEARSRAFLKVQDGCHNCCSFCIIPFVRPYASLPFAEVLAEAQRRLEQGYRELVLTGVNIGHYGLTPIASVHEIASAEHFTRSRLYERVAGHATLWDLLDALLALLDAQYERTGLDSRLRISSIEPEEIEPRFFEQLAHPRMCPHLHLPLQSGSDKVLAEMRRLYDVATYRARAEAFRRTCPNGALTTDIITGHPGEGEAEFEETLALCSELGFERLHGFPFSPRPGTRAAMLVKKHAGVWASLPASVASTEGRPPEVQQSLPSRTVALKRNRRLIAHCEEIAQVRWPRMLGLTARVLVEQRRDGCWEGHGEAYQQVRFPAAEGDGDLTGQLVDVRLGVHGDGWFRGAPS